jgi:hypothetical protein
MVRAVLALLVMAASPAQAEVDVCHAVDVELQPESRTDIRPGDRHAPQIVVWVEKADGTFVDTVFITQATGTYGLGNRPGRMDFNSAPMWPYGRRTTTFPVWADRKPERFDLIVFNNGQEHNLSHPVNESSRESHFCRPTMPEEPAYDAMSCATTKVETDKGERDSAQSKYPPRQDMTRDPSRDDPSVEMFPDMNPYDAISAATPATGQLARIGWSPPFDLADGDYVMWVEVSTEFDHNATYSKAAYPAPTGIPWSEYGAPYRGQPSVLYKVPFTVDDAEHTTLTTAYAGYGDPEGDDGMVRAPDATITTNLLGSGEGRLALVADPTGAYRVRVTSRHELDYVAPNDPSELAIVALTGRSVSLSFVAPGDDAVAGTVRGYEVRYRIGANNPVTAENFDASDSIVVPPSIVPVAAGGIQELEVPGLLPETAYSVGIRAYDDCHNASAVTSVAFVTTARSPGEVDACFVATAAYGSVLAADVAQLRGVRDSILRKTVLGELFVQAYYTFGPPIAGVIGESELLRWTAREALAPIVKFATSLPLADRLR